MIHTLPPRMAFAVLMVLSAALLIMADVVWGGGCGDITSRNTAATHVIVIPLSGERLLA